MFFLQCARPVTAEHGREQLTGFFLPFDCIQCDTRTELGTRVGGKSEGVNDCAQAKSCANTDDRTGQLCESLGAENRSDTPTHLHFNPTHPGPRY